MIVPEGVVCRVALYPGEGKRGVPPEVFDDAVRRRDWDVLHRAECKWWSPWRHRWMTRWSDELVVPAHAGSKRRQSR